MNWSDFFRGTHPRSDLQETFPPSLMEGHQPVLLGASMVHALAVGMRVMHVFGRRGATRISEQMSLRILEVLHVGMDEHMRAHCDDEATRILNWLESPPLSPESGIPELDVMIEGDVASRFATVEFAMKSEMDVELQYFDATLRRWPRVTGTPIRLDAETEMVVIETSQGRVNVDADHIRWVMPVQRRVRPKIRSAEVLTFPKKPE